MIVIMSNRNRLKIQVSGISELNIEWKNSRCGAVPTIYLFGCGSHTHTRPINFNMISYTVNWRLYFFCDTCDLALPFRVESSRTAYADDSISLVVKKLFDAGISV